MKNTKLLKTLVLIALIPLSGCHNKSDIDKDSLSIVCPTGAPAIAFYNFAGKSNFQTNTDPTNIIPLMKSGSIDVAVLPTNAGVSAIQSGQVDFKLAATITFGNVFVASTGHDLNGVMEPGDYIVSFQQGSVPDKIFHSVYGSQFDSSIHYVGSAQLAAQALKSGKNIGEPGQPNVDYVVLAQPALYTVLNSTPGRNQYANLQELYKQSHQGQIIYQASIFVSNKIRREIINQFLSTIKQDVEDACTNPDLIVNGLSNDDNAEVIFGVKPEIAKAVTLNNNGMGLGYAYAKDNKTGIDTFLQELGLGETNEEIYF